MNWLRHLKNTSSAISILAPLLIVLAGTLLPMTAQGQIEEIVVTAQKREQNLQDVPLAVSAVSGETLDDFGMDSWDDIEMPAVHIGSGMRNESLFIRGVGSGVNTGFEQAVPIYIDGTYYGRGRAENIALFDLQRVEVLRGPQPIYLGKNAIGGALSLTSRRPADEFEGTVQVSNEFEHDEVTVFGAVSVPFSDNFKARAAVKYRDMDGWLNNVSLNGRQESQVEDVLARVSAEWKVTDSLNIYAKFEHSDSEQDGQNNQLFLCPPGSLARAGIDPAVETCAFDETRAAAINPALHPDNNFMSTSPYLEDLELNGGQVAINWDLNGYLLSSVTSYYDYDHIIKNFDIDSTPAPLGTARIGEKFDQLSTEFRVLSPRDERLTWVLGFYYDEGDLKDAGIVGSVANTLPIPGTRISPDVTSHQSEESWAVFGEVGYQVLDPLTLKFAFRYTEAKKEMDHSAAINIVVGNPAILGIPIPGPIVIPGAAINPGLAPYRLLEQRKDTDFQPSITAEWRPNDDHMFYFSWKEGFKAGGFDLDAFTFPFITGTLGFEPEEVTAYEVGARMDFLGGNARLNVTAFRSEYENLQVAVFNGVIGFNTANAAESRSQGVEVEGTWALTEHLTLNGSFIWLDAEYQDFPGAACFTGQPAPGCTLVAPSRGPGQAPTFAQDLSGQDLSFAPEISGTVGATYRQPLDFQVFGNTVEFVSRVDVFFTDDFSTDGDGDPAAREDGFAKIDLRVALADQGGKWEFAFVGRNITDELTSHWRSDTTGLPGTYTALTDRTRQLGIQARLSF